MCVIINSSQRVSTTVFIMRVKQCTFWTIKKISRVRLLR